MKEETDLREVVVGFLQGESLFAGAVVPIISEEETSDRKRPCVTVEIEANGRLVPGMPVKRLKIEVLTQRNDTSDEIASGWAQEVLSAIEGGKLELAALMYARGWLLKGFSIEDAEEEKEGKRAWTGGTMWRVVLCAV